MRKVKIAIWAGHIVECFDNTLYGFFAVMLAPTFFPPVSEYSQTLASFGAFAAGFIARPMGAFFFGLVGDTKGRQLPIVWSMAFVSIPTIAIGLIPSYESLGIASSALLIVCRILQGVCYGGEFSGVNIYLAESNTTNLGRQTGTLISIGVLGATLATLLGSISYIDGMPTWSWRLLFIFGGLMALATFMMRKNIMETDEFKQAQDSNRILSNPWKEIFAKYKFKMLLSTIIAGLTIIPLYCSTIYANQIFKALGFSFSQSLVLNTISLIVNGTIIFFSGILADRIGFRRHMLLGSSLTALVAFPSFYCIAGAEVSLLQVMLFSLSLVSAGAIINGCTMPYIASFFPTNCRYSAVASSVTIGQALFGGTTPLICSFLQMSMNTRMAAAYWVFAIASLTVMGLVLLTQRVRSRSNQATPVF